MVGHEHRQQHVGHREAVGRQQRGVPPRQGHHLTVDSVEEDIRIKRTDDQRQRHHILHAVHPQQPRQPLVDQRERPDHEREQRMAVHLIHDVPVRHPQICQRVVAREVHLALKHPPVGSEALLHEQGVHPADKQSVEHHDHRQGDHRLDALLGFDLEQLEGFHICKCCFRLQNYKKIVNSRWRMADYLYLCSTPTKNEYE